MWGVLLTANGVVRCAISTPGSCEFEALPAWVQHTCTDQILVEVHGCLPRLGSATARLHAVHNLMAALEPQYAIFARTPNLLAGGGACVEYSLRRRTPCAADHPSPQPSAAAPAASVPLATAMLASATPIAATVDTNAHGASGADKPVAACLVGQLRSLARTAGALRRHLLDALDADAFVVATTDSGRPPTTQEARMLDAVRPSAACANLASSQPALHHHPASHHTSSRRASCGFFLH